MDVDIGDSTDEFHVIYPGDDALIDNEHADNEPADNAPADNRLGDNRSGDNDPGNGDDRPGENNPDTPISDPCKVRKCFVEKIRLVNKFPKGTILPLSYITEILRRNNAPIAKTQKATMVKIFGAKLKRLPTKQLEAVMKQALLDGRSSKFRLGQTVTQKAEAAMERKKIKEKVVELTAASKMPSTSNQAPLTTYLEVNDSIPGPSKPRVSYSHALITHLSHEIVTNDNHDNCFSDLPDIVMKGQIEDALQKIFSSNISQDLMRIHPLVPCNTNDILVQIKALIKQVEKFE